MRVIISSLLIATAGLMGCAGASVEHYQPVACRIVAESQKSDAGWKKMEELCDGIGNRISGSASLEKATAWAEATMKADGQENVRREPVMVPKWVRGNESCEMIEPRPVKLAMLGLGGSIGTPAEGITGEVVCVVDEDDLEKHAAEVKGKIVLFNNAMPPYDAKNGSRYGKTVRFRHHGAVLASKHGAIACLIRSVTARSLRSPHTGAMSYDGAERKIPAAAISIEDAESISRLIKRGIGVKVTLKMEARDEGTSPSANVIGEIVGREKPDEIVVMGGHIDSWDVGQGAQDDGAGIVISMEALHLIRKLDLKPRRTIRVVCWTNEENGLAGGKEYARAHAAELGKHVAAIESDSGCFPPVGLSVQCKDKKREATAARQVRAIASLLSPLGNIRTDVGHSGADVGPMEDGGAMLMGFEVEGSKYFDYHHTQADTLDKIDPKDLKHCAAAMAITAFVIADMPERLGG